MRAVIDVVLPIFVIILIGFLAGRHKLLGAASSDALNRFVYFIALPVLLFHALAKTEPAQILNVPFLAAYLGAQALLLVAAAALALVAFRRPLEEASLFAMASVFGNTGYMGIPLAAAAFGSAAAVPAAIATVFGTALIIAVSTIGIELGLTAHGRRYRHVLTDVVAALAKSPLIMASLLGIIWSVAEVPLWTPLDRLCGILGAAAGPCALIAIGLFLVGKRPSSGIAESGAIIALKLVVHPLLTALLALAVFDVEPLWATVAILMAALPMGANVFVLAQRYDVYVERVSAATLLTTVLAVITLSALFTRPGWGTG
jgi:predicted permease